MTRGNTYLLLLAAGTMVAAAAPAFAATAAEREHLRWSAAHAVILAGGIINAVAMPAIRHIYFQLTGKQPGSHFKEYVARWYCRMRRRGSVAPNKPGCRPPKVDNATIVRVATVLTQGTVGRGANARPYISMAEVSWAAPRGVATSALSTAPPLPLPPPLTGMRCRTTNTVTCRHVRRTKS